MGIEDILRIKDEKRGGKGSKQDAYEREVQARFAFSEHIATALINAILALRDKALGEPVRLPIAAKPSETPVFIECEGLVRLTLLCHIRADLNGEVYCSAIDLSMSRNSGRSVRGQFEPVRPNLGSRATKFGFPERTFAIDAAKFRTAIEGMAHQL